MNEKRKGEKNEEKKGDRLIDINYFINNHQNNLGYIK